MILAAAHTAGHHLTMGQSTAVVAVLFAVVVLLAIAGIRRLLGFGKPRQQQRRTY